MEKKKHRRRVLETEFLLIHIRRKLFKWKSEVCLSTQFLPQSVFSLSLFDFFINDVKLDKLTAHYFKCRKSTNFYLQALDQQSRYIPKEKKHTHTYLLWETCDNAWKKIFFLSQHRCCHNEVHIMAELLPPKDKQTAPLLTHCFIKNKKKSCFLVTVLNWWRAEVANGAFKRTGFNNRACIFQRSKWLCLIKFLKPAFCSCQSFGFYENLFMKFLRLRKALRGA